MTNDNRTNLKVDHGQPTRGKRSILGFISIMACLLILLLIASCQPVNVQTFTKLYDSDNEGEQ